MSKHYNERMFKLDLKNYGVATANYNDGWLKSAGENYKTGYHNGFFRACELIMSAGKKWKVEDRRLFNKVSRKLFGRKRAKKK